MAEPTRKSKPTVASFVVFVEPDGSESPAVVHSVPDEGEGLNLFVLNGKVDSLKRNVLEREHKSDVEVWHR